MKEILNYLSKINKKALITRLPRNKDSLWNNKKLTGEFSLFCIQGLIII